MTDMQYAPLGRSGINVSKVCLGGMSFGKASPDFHQWTIDQQGTEQVIGHAIDRGINFIDTANCYAFGTSEEYIGQALRNLNVARDQVVLASKVYFNDGQRMARAGRRASVRVPRLNRRAHTCDSAGSSQTRLNLFATHM